VCSITQDTAKQQAYFLTDEEWVKLKPHFVYNKYGWAFLNKEEIQYIIRR
jgi:hypothetical protein